MRASMRGTRELRWARAPPRLVAVSKHKRPRNLRSRLREPIVQHPIKVTALLSSRTLAKSSYFKESRTPSANPPLVLRDDTLARRGGPEGIRTLTCHLDGVPCCRYTTGPREKPKPARRVRDGSFRKFVIQSLVSGMPIWPPKMQMAPESPEPFARIDKSARQKSRLTP